MRTRARLLSIVVAATLLAGAAPAHAAAPSFDRAWCDGDADDRAAFAAYMKAVLRAAGVTGDIAYDAEGFTLGSGDRGQLIGLGNTLRDRCQSDDDAPVERAARVFASIFSGNQFAGSLDGGDARKLLMPVIRARAWREAFRLHAARAAIETHATEPTSLPPVRAIGEDLVLLVAIDQPESIRYANASELADWKLDFDRALAIARENLAAQPKPQVTDVGGGAWLLEGHAYTSSYALWTPKALAALVGAKTEQLIVFAPSPEVLVVAIATDAEAVAHAATLAMTVHKEAPRGVSLIAMAPGADGVPTEVEPAAGPLALVAQMRFMDRFDAYGSLSEPLAALLAAKGDKTPVAPRFVARYGDLGFSAVAVLSRGEKAYLPEADLVLLRDGTGDDAKVLGAARWVELRKVLGDAITTLPDAYPPRYLVARFPTAEELAKMDLVSTDELQK